MIKSLYQIKKIRLLNAEIRLNNKKKQIAQIKNELARLSKEKDEYHDWRINEEHRLFEEAKVNLLNLRELENIQQSLTLYLETETEFDTSISSIMTQLDDEEIQLANHIAEYDFSVKKLEKIKYLKAEQQLDGEKIKNNKDEITQEEIIKNNKNNIIHLF